MDSYVTGTTIKQLREKRNFTQLALANMLGVSDKTVSKWETGKGYPDITLLEPLANALSVSVSELLSGTAVTNTNKGFNMKRCFFYVCPVCSNVIVSTGETVVCCHGITLPPLMAEQTDDGHKITVQNVEDEYYVTVNHDMSKSHYISFFAALSDNSAEIVKLYPEGNAEARFKRSRTSSIFAFCNKHGLFKIKL